MMQKTQKVDDDSRPKSSTQSSTPRVNPSELTLLDMPHWFINKFINKLTPRDLCSLACTSKAWKFIVEDEDLWKRICCKLYKGNIPFRGTWKRTVVDLKKPVPTVEACKATTHEPERIEGTDAWHKKRLKRYHIASANMCDYDLQFDKIDRRSNLSLEDFITQYDRLQKPVIITDAIDAWPMKNWTKESILRDHGDVVLRCGSGFKMSIANYVRYMETQNDAFPLYLFDGKLDERAPDILNSWSIPKYFEEDYFSLLDEDDRPPFRWVLWGPARTGPAFHIDPYKTGAWNSVVFGKKRWTMYAPDENPPGAGDPDSEYYEAPRPLQWFRKYGPLLTERNQPFEFMHRAGETLFLPPGWWHQVVNLEETLAVTQNFVNAQSFKIIYKDTKKDKSFHKIVKHDLVEKYDNIRQSLSH